MRKLNFFLILLSFAVCSSTLSAIPQITKLPALSETEVRENREFAERVRKAALDCSEIEIEYSGQNQLRRLNSQEKSELCQILSRVQPVQHYYFCHIWWEYSGIRFLSADGSEIMTLAIYEFGHPQTLTDATKIWLSKEDAENLLKILGLN